jgi:hypothetical protein
MTVLPNLKFNVVSEYVGKGLTTARKDINGFTKTLNKLGAAVGIAFSAQAVVAFGKASVRAFSNAQREAVLLNNSLKNLGLSFASPQISNYIKEIGRLYGVTGGEAVPAMQALLSATGSVTKSQELMNTALNISADTGISITETAKGLSQAYLGNRKALNNYNTGLTKAELQTKSFDDILKIINKRMEGSAAAAAGTFSGEMKILTENAEQAKEVIGKGLIDAIKILTGDTSTKDLADTMGEYADNTARGLRNTAKLIKTINAPLNFASGTFASFIESTQKYADLLIAGDPSGFFKKPIADSPAKKLIPQLSPAERNMAVMAAKKAEETAKRLRKIEQDRLNNLKKIAAEKAKQLALDKLSAVLNQANKLFDNDRISLAAAAASKQTEEDRVRIRLKTNILELEDAIAEGNVQNAAKYASFITQDAALLGQLRGVMMSLGDVPNPFSEWLNTLEKMLAALLALPNVKPVTELPANWQSFAGTGKNAYEGSGSGLSVLGSGNYGGLAGAGIYGGGGMPVMANGGVVTNPTVALIGEAGPEAVIPLSRMGSMGSTYVTVNVAGSVSTERDLVDAITQGIYNNQAAGIPINYSTVY